MLKKTLLQTQKQIIKISNLKSYTLYYLLRLTVGKIRVKI